MPTLPSNRQLLLIGASRGLGFALAKEYLKRGWRVVATERNRATSQLHHLAETSGDRLVWVPEILAHRIPEILAG